jgi:membrane protease YdiL (CAAX protease family)
MKQNILHPLITFFGLAYLISWIIWLPLYSHIFGINGLWVLPLHHALGGLGPMIASLLTSLIFYKTEGLKQLFKKIIQVKPLLYFLIALFSPFALVTLASVINSFITGASLHITGLFSTKEFQDLGFAAFFIYNLIFFGFGEETGWRGFALPKLQEKWNALTSAVILTFFWALWHWPLFFYRAGYTHMDMAGMSGWILSLLTGSILLTWLYNSSRGSIFICAIFHSTIDIAFTADLADKNIVNYMGMLITIWGILTVAIFRSALSRTKTLH